MSKRTAFVGFVVVAVLAACSQKAPPSAPAPADQAVLDETAKPARTVPPEAPAPKSYDKASVASEMMRLIADRPECQPYRDELQSIASAGSTEPPYAVVKKAREAGCAAQKK